MDTTLSLNQIARLALANGHRKTYIIEGPMGSGKSSIHELIRKMVGDKYDYRAVDCTQLDVGDIQVPDVNRDTGMVRFVPNEAFFSPTGKPMFVNFDEVGKANRTVQNSLLPILLERRVGNKMLHPETVVLGTTNLGAEGVGDLFQPHARNRVSFVEMRYPTNEEWIEWAVDKSVPAPVLLWAKENPAVFQSFKQWPKAEDNPYIFHPKEQRRSFVTPRSLYLASFELQDDVRAMVADEDATLAAIAGNIGERAARDMMSFVHLADKLPRWQEVLNDPMGAMCPVNDPGALMLMMWKCVTNLDDKDNNQLSTILKYVFRMPMEVQAVFATTVMRSNKSTFVARNRDFTNWATKNSWVCR